MVIVDFTGVLQVLYISLDRRLTVGWPSADRRYWT